MRQPPLEIRQPQPSSELGRGFAESIWKRRYEIVAVPCEPAEPTHVDIFVTPSLALHLRDGTDKQLIHGTMSYGEGTGEAYVAAKSHGTRVSYVQYPWIIHAWRAAQAARLLSELGLDDGGTDGLDLCYPEDPNPGRIASLRRMFTPKRRETIAEVLERRLDDEISRRLDDMTLSSPTDYVMEIGNGVVIDAARFEPILAVSHPDHGTLTLPGRSAEQLNARMDALRLIVQRSLPSGGSRESARIGRMIEICHEAVATDPDMTDDAGTPLRPLLDEHLPRLAERHRAAIAASSVDERARIDEEVAASLEGITESVAQGMATRSREKRDALRTELQFIRARHPVRTLGEAA